MNLTDVLDSLEPAIEALERALDRPDPQAIAVASELLGASLAPLRTASGAIVAEHADRFAAALARVEGLRARIAVLADFDRERLAIAAQSRAGLAGPVYARNGRMRLVSGG
ncbi:hypothetical protein D1610_08475 [Sphingomonas gilva]|uniref:Uncharacterized protein n=1 Tax=Sphingomonas gilva TaxID=2305907 RepID=A0A396RPK8_9SPHN|nr:hypothetical protein [Sphingomonas gilva]RHW18470.1 hypothetical protein D1610_08475 [Sphingomonas gilva]